MMKKIFIAAMIGMCFASCNNNDDFTSVNGEAQKISFSSPLVKSASRAQFSPTPGEMQYGYNEEEWFHVYAVMTEGPYTGTETWATKFMDVDVMPYKADIYSSAEYWKPEKDYFWPKNPNAYITFAAFSPATAVKNGTFSYAGDGLTITDFQLPTDRGTQYELLYAKRAFDKKKNDHVAGEYNGNEYLGVNIVFQRALSAIKFHVSTESGAGKVWLKRLAIEGAYDKATFKENVTNQATTYTASPEWTGHAYKNSTNSLCEPFNSLSMGGASDIGQSAVERESLFMIPQTLAEGVKLIIEWEYQNGDRTEKEQDAYTVNMNTLGITEWLPGKKYTYNIKINLDKIYFKPTMEDWSSASPSAGDVIL